MIGMKARRCVRCNRVAKRDKARRQHQERTPEQIAHRKAVQKAWRERNKLRYLKSKRMGRLTGTYGYVSREKYLKAMRNQNERRKERKRELMRNLYRQRSTTWGKPHYCRQCAAVVPFNGVGRPRLDCFECRPERVAA
jgi:hypothetical protein